MSWLFRKKPDTQDDLNVEANSKVEVIAHKKATRQQINSTKKVNQQLNDLLVENGFTLKIYLAAGGKHPRAKQSGSTTK